LLPLLPNGAGVALELPIITGSGALSLINGGPDIAGALAVRIPPMSASAFAVLSPARADTPLSFLAILGATFPPPGIQIGFGFAVSGVGGVVGVNRRIDREALIRAVSDGSVAQLLFSHRSEQGRGGCDRRVAGDLPGGPRIGRGGADVPDAGVGGSSACRRRYCWRCPARSG